MLSRAARHRQRVTEVGMGVGELEPLPDGLGEQARALAVALRGLFPGLGVSLRRYAARRHRDAGTVSRYLNGKRIPPWEFVHDMFIDVAEAQGNPPTAETMDLLRQLHLQALAAGDSPSHAVQLLQNQLAEADRLARQAATRQEVIDAALQDAQHRLADLDVQRTELEAAWDQERQALNSELQHYHDRHNELKAERDRLACTVASLQRELDAAQRRRLEAENRCEQLEHQLGSAEAQAAKAAADEHEQAERELREYREYYKQRVQDLTAELAQLRSHLGADQHETANTTGHIRGQHTGPAHPSRTGLEADEAVTQPAAHGVDVGHGVRAVHTSGGSDSGSLEELARQHERSGDDSSALGYYLKAAAAGSNGARMHAARLQVKAGNVAEAERLYQEAFEAGSVEALSYLFRLREKAGDDAGAETIALQIATETGDSGSLLTLAKAREAAGDHTGAERLYLQAAAAGSVIALSYLAQLRETVGDHTGAETIARQLATETGNTYPLEHLACLREAAGDRDGAVHLFREAADAGSQSAQTQLHRLLE